MAILDFTRLPSSEHAGHLCTDQWQRFAMMVCKATRVHRFGPLQADLREALPAVLPNTPCGIDSLVNMNVFMTHLTFDQL